MDSQEMKKNIEVPSIGASKGKKRKIDVALHDVDISLLKNGSRITPRCKKIAVKQSLTPSLMTQVLTELSNEHPALRNTKITLAPELESFLTRLTKDYIESTLKFAIVLAKHRQATSVEPKDMEFSIKKKRKR
jgi:hypothetical protein